ncbi:MAG: hypothetical protein R2724_14300 [Bryobacterales bacterium]
MSIIDVEIEKLVYGGAGPCASGWPDGADPVLPGEQVTAEVVRESAARIARQAGDMASAIQVARAVESARSFSIAAAAATNTSPTRLSSSSRSKILRETLARLGKIEWTGEIETISAEPWGYRNRTQLRIFKRRTAPRLGSWKPVLTPARAGDRLSDQLAQAQRGARAAA